MSLVVPQVAALRVGMPEDDADITPVVSESSANFIEGLVNDAREKGEGDSGAGRMGLTWQFKKMATPEAC